MRAGWRASQVYSASLSSGWARIVSLDRVSKRRASSESVVVFSKRAVQTNKNEINQSITLVGFATKIPSDSKNKKTLNGAAVFVVLVTILGETLVCWNLKNKSEIYFRKIHLEKIALPFLSSTLRLNQTISAAGLALRTRHWSTTSSPSRDGIRAPAAWSTISTLLGGTVKKETKKYIRQKFMFCYIFQNTRKKNAHRFRASKPVYLSLNIFSLKKK